MIPSSETIMVLGGNLYSLPSIATLKAHEFRVIVADGNPKAPGIRIANVQGHFDFRDVDKGIALARKERVGAVIPTHDRGVVPAALISKALGLRGPSPEAAAIATSKKLMRQVWQDTGLPSPDIGLARSEEEFRNAVAVIGFPAICKPTADVGGGSRGVRKLDDSTDLAQAYRFAISFGDSPEVLVEPFFEGIEHSVEVLMQNGDGTVLMVSDKVKTPPPYRVDKSVIYPTRMTGAAFESIRSVSVKAAKAVGLVDGAAHVELCTLPDGSNVLFEIGLRTGGGVTPHPVAELVCGVNEMVEYAAILLGHKGRDYSPRYAKGAVFHFITAPPGRICSIEGFQKAASLPGIVDARLAAVPGDTVNEVRTSADRLGYFVSAGETADEAYAKAVAAERELRFIMEPA